MDNSFWEGLKKSKKTESILWLIVAIINLAAAIYSIIAFGWLSSIPDFTLMIVSLYCLSTCRMDIHLAELVLAMVHYYDHMEEISENNDKVFEAQSKLITALENTRTRYLDFLRSVHKILEENLARRTIYKRDMREIYETIDQHLKDVEEAELKAKEAEEAAAKEEPEDADQQENQQ